MMLEIKNATYIGDYKIEVTFNDGSKGVADFKEYVQKKAKNALAPLKDERFFSRAFTHPEFGTLSWQNEIDIAPEFVYFLAFKNDQNLQEKFKEWGYV